MKLNWSMMLGALCAVALLATACGGGDDDAGGDETTTSVDAQPSDVDGESDEAGEPAPDEESDGAPADGEESGEESTDSDDGSSGDGVILADLCAGDEFLDGAVSLDDLVSYGMFTSTDVVIESNAAYDASTYETFGFICNLSETVADGENFMTIGVSSGSGTWDLAVEQGDAPIEQMGDWEVIVGSNWLSPLTMRITDDAGNQDSLFVVWTPADGSIPDAATLERLMRPLGEAIATRSSVDIPRS